MDILNPLFLAGEFNLILDFPPYHPFSFDAQVYSVPRFTTESRRGDVNYEVSWFSVTSFGSAFDQIVRPSPFPFVTLISTTRPVVVVAVF